METIIANLTALPTLSFFSVWAILFVLLFSSLILGVGMDFDIDVDSSIVPNIFVVTGLTKTPIILSLFIVFSIGLALTYFTQWVFLPYLGLPFFQGDLTFMEKAIGLLLFFPIFIVSLYIASPILNYIGKAIESRKPKPINFIGMECEISTGEVSPTFGEAFVFDGGKKYIIDVVSEDKIMRGEKAIVVEKNNDGHFIVKKLINHNH